MTLAFSRLEVYSIEARYLLLSEKCFVFWFLLEKDFGCLNYSHFILIYSFNQEILLSANCMPENMQGIHSQWT